MRHRWIPLLTAGALLLGGIVLAPRMLQASLQETLATMRRATENGRTVGEVLVRGRVVMRLVGSGGGLSAEDRADIVVNRLNRVHEDRPLRAADFRASRVNGQEVLFARETQLITVLPADAQALRSNESATADRWLDALTAAVSGDRNGDRRDDDRREDDRRRDDDRAEGDPADVGDPELKKKLVPILTVGSSLNIGVAQVQGRESDVNRCKAVAQIETDYKDVARIKILVPIQSEKIVKSIDRVPGVSVSAIADFAIRR